MNDKELLELAAKAAGISWDVSRDSITGWMLATLCEDDESGGQMVEDKSWRPLQDDGDALRLAMQLQMTLELGHKGCIVKMWGWPEVSEMCHPDSSDNPECTRRAIVRAAAQIGEVLP